MADLIGAGIDPSTSKLYAAQLPDVAVTQSELDAALAAAGITGSVGAALALKADKDSPAFTGTPTAPTPSTVDNDTSIATTAFVQSVNGPAGSTIVIPCPGGVQPLRNTKTTRTDIIAIWQIPTEPSQAAGYALPGDWWQRVLV